MFLPPVANRAAADKRAAELKAAGLKDVLVVDGGPQRFAISLGAFRTEDAAKAQLAELAKKGVAGAKVGPRSRSCCRRCSSCAIRSSPSSPGCASSRPRIPAADTEDRRLREDGVTARPHGRAWLAADAAIRARRRGLALARALFVEYAQWLKVDLCFQGFDGELATLPGAYAPPRGRLLLAGAPGDAFGCIALRPLSAG